MIKLSFKRRKHFEIITKNDIQVIFFVLIIILCLILQISQIEANNNTKDSKNAKPISKQENSEKAKNNFEDNVVEAKKALYDYERPTAEEESYTWLIFKTIFVLCALVGGFYYFFRFVTRKTGIQTLGGEVIKILSIVPVGQNKFLQVIDLAGRILILGISDSNINLISEIEDKDEIDRIRLLSSKSTPIQPGGFQEYVSRYISKFLGKSADFNTAVNMNSGAKGLDIDKLNYLKRQRERLKNINGKDHEK